MAVSFGALGTVVATTTATTTVTPPAGVAAGDLLVLVAMVKLGPTSQPALAGWTPLGFVSHGSTASGNDAGSMRAHVWTKVAVGGEGSETITWGTTPAAGQAFMYRLANATGFWSTALATAVRTATTTAWSVTYGSDPGIAAGDFLSVVNAVPTDLNTASSAGSLSAAGVTTMGLATERIAHRIDAGGSDSAIWFDSFQPVLGSSTAAATYSSTLTGGTNLYGVSVLLRAREVAAPANLVTAAGDHAHTADQLTLTQDHQLAVAGAAHGHTADHLVLVQTSTLVIDDTAHAQTVDPVTLHLVTTTDLLVDSAQHAQAAEDPALTQTHLLTVAGTGHATTTDALVLGQLHQLGTHDTVHAHTAATPTLGQLHLLTVDGTGHTHTAETIPALPSTSTLQPADTQHAHTADLLALAVVLGVHDSSHAHSADLLQLVGELAIDIAGSGHGHTADLVLLEQLHQLLIDGTLHVQLAQHLTYPGDVGDDPPAGRDRLTVTTRGRSALLIQRRSAGLVPTARPAEHLTATARSRRR